MIDRRSLLLGSVVAVAMVTVGESLSHGELRLLARAAAPVSPSVDDYNRDRIINKGTEEKKLLDSLIERGFFRSEDNSNPNIECDNFVVLTDKGRAALRTAGVPV